MLNWKFFLVLTRERRFWVFFHPPPTGLSSREIENNSNSHILAEISPLVARMQSHAIACKYFCLCSFFFDFHSTLSRSSHSSRIDRFICIFNFCHVSHEGAREREFPWRRNVCSADSRPVREKDLIYWFYVWRPPRKKNCAENWNGTSRHTTTQWRSVGGLFFLQLHWIQYVVDIVFLFYVR